MHRAAPPLIPWACQLAGPHTLLQLGVLMCSTRPQLLLLGSHRLLPPPPTSGASPTPAAPARCLPTAVASPSPALPHQSLSQTAPEGDAPEAKKGGPPSPSL